MPKESSEVIEKPAFIYRGKGCESCKITGYKGRIAIYEILLINEQIRQLMLEKASASQIKKKALQLGLRTLLREGWEKVAEGLTTPEEVMRVTEID